MRVAGQEVLYETSGSGQEFAIDLTIEARMAAGASSCASRGGYLVGQTESASGGGVQRWTTHDAQGRRWQIDVAMPGFGGDALLPGETIILRGLRNLSRFNWSGGYLWIERGGVLLATVGQSLPPPGIEVRPLSDCITSSCGGGASPYPAVEVSFAGESVTMHPWETASLGGITIVHGFTESQPVLCAEAEAQSVIGALGS